MGDEVISPVAYVQNVEGFRKDVALVAMPFLYTDWYVSQLRRQYPNLNVPFEKYDGRTGTLRAFFDANRGRPLAALGITGDDSIKEAYWTHRRGLVEIVEPMSVDVNLKQLMADNEKVFSRYRPPSSTEVKHKSLDIALRDQYAIPAIVIGQQCEQARYLKDAKRWYERALQLNPSLTQVQEALARVQASFVGRPPGLRGALSLADH
jgi:hypothetical protein